MAKLSFVALVAGVAASRSEEGTALLQAGNVEQANSREQRLFSMKQQILAFAESGVPTEAVGFLNTIATSLRDDVLAEIVKERDGTQTSHDGLYAQFAAADAVFTTNKGNVGSDATEKTAHTTCRTQEGVDYQETVVCDGEQDTAQGLFDGAEATVKSLGSDSDVCNDGWTNSDAADLTAYLNAGTAAIQRRGELRTKISECDGLDGELATQKGLCDADQRTYEAAACSVAVATQSANTNYAAAYATAKDTFEGQFTGWENQNTDRLAQCDLVNKLICYVEALVAHDDSGPLQGAISACDAAEPDCSGVSFSASATPAATAAAVLPATACQEGFDYGDFPAGTAAATCQACAGIA